MDAIRQAAMAPALVPATRGKEYPASSRTSTAPARPIPLTPPPSRARSARSCGRCSGSAGSTYPSTCRRCSAAASKACWSCGLRAYPRSLPGSIRTSGEAGSGLFIGVSPITAAIQVPATRRHSPPGGPSIMLPWRPARAKAAPFTRASAPPGGGRPRFRGPSARSALRGGALPEPVALHLPALGAGQGGDELDRPRVLVGRDHLLGEGLKLGGLVRAGRHAVAQHHVRHDDRSALGIGRADHPRLQHVRVPEQG